MSEVQPGVWVRLTETCRPDEGERVAIVSSRYVAEWGEAVWSGGRFHVDRGSISVDDTSHWLRIPPAPKDGE